MRHNVLKLILSVLLIISSFSISADDKATAEDYVNRSLVTLENFSNDPNMGWFRDNIRNAKGILILPVKLEAAFMVGGAGGTGVLLKHNNDGRWTQPAFYGAGEVSFGFQAGAQVTEVVMLIMTEKGVDALLSSKAQLGADISVALGPIGAGAAVATTDILQFSRNKGVFGGVAAEGAVISPFNTLNAAYYGEQVSAVDILVRGKGTNPQAREIMARLQGLTDFAVVFAYQSAKINATAQVALNRIVQMLGADSSMTLQITGYTDETVNPDETPDLGLYRAQSVKGYLVAQGVDAQRLSVNSFATANPVAANMPGSLPGPQAILKVSVQ